MASPGRGFRPGRGALVRIWKLPKPEIFTSFPSTRLSEIRSKNASIMSFDSRLLSPICSNSNSARCALVNAGVSRLSTENSMRQCSWRFYFGRFVEASGTQTRPELTLQIREHRLNGRLNPLVGQCSGVARKHQAHGQAFFTQLHAGTGLLRPIDIEQGRALEQTLRGRAVNGRHERGMRDVLRNDDGDVALHRLQLADRLELGHRALQDRIQFQFEKQWRLGELIALAPLRMQLAHKAYDLAIHRHAGASA